MRGIPPGKGGAGLLSAAASPPQERRAPLPNSAYCCTVLHSGWLLYLLYFPNSDNGPYWV